MILHHRLSPVVLSATKHIFTPRRSCSHRTMSTSKQAIDVLKLPTWLQQSTSSSPSPKSSTSKPLYPINNDLASHISLYEGDITKLQCDAIVNAANSQLLHGGGICGAIFKVAGSRELSDECRKKYPNGCPTGSTVITSAFQLPCKYILHTVAPQDQSSDKMQQCYQSIYQLCTQHELQSIAICCIGTGIFGFPAVKACQIALEETRKFLEDKQRSSTMQRIIFCTFWSKDTEIYRQYLPLYFPTSNNDSQSTSNNNNNNTGKM